MNRVRISGLAIGLTICAAIGSIAVAERPSSQTVAVPHVVGKLMTDAYGRLHRAGLRVSIPAGVDVEFGWPLYVERLAPSAGRRVPQGSVVTMTLGCPCGAPSIASPIHQPAYRVPDFRGQRLSAVYAWIADKVLAFDAHLGPLRAGTAAQLGGNYRVTRQRPRAGTVLRFEGGPQHWITPLTVWGKQRSGG